MLLILKKKIPFGLALDKCLVFNLYILAANIYFYVGKSSQIGQKKGKKKSKLLNEYLCWQEHENLVVNIRAK